MIFDALRLASYLRAFLYDEYQYCMKQSIKHEVFGLFFVVNIDLRAVFGSATFAYICEFLQLLISGAIMPGLLHSQACSV